MSKKNKKEKRITSQFFELRVSLNRTNQLKNQNTEVVFELKSLTSIEKNFYATILHHSENQKIILSSKVNGTWVPGQFTEFAELESFTSDMLNEEPHKHFHSEFVRFLAIRIKSYAIRDRD